MSEFFSMDNSSIMILISSISFSVTNDLVFGILKIYKLCSFKIYLPNLIYDAKKLFINKVYSVYIYNYAKVELCGI